MPVVPEHERENRAELPRLRRVARRAQPGERIGLARSAAPEGYDRAAIWLQHLPGRGEIVPVAEINLGQGDSIFFEHHVMLWKDDSVPLTVMQLQGGMKRALAGMPFIISVASGPGRIAFSRDATGELVILPLHPSMELDVREHAFLLCSHHIDYTYVRIKGLTNILFGGQGMFMDRFISKGQQGLLILHGYGNVFERVLKAGESILVEPGAFLYKDSSVTMNIHPQKLTSGFLGGVSMNLANMTGPGRVGIQSMYVHHHTD